MKTIISGKEINAAVKTSQQINSSEFSWVIDLIADTSQKMYKKPSKSEQIIVPEWKKKKFEKLIKTDVVLNVLNENHFRIIETDYGNFYLSCRP